MPNNNSSDTTITAPYSEGARYLRELVGNASQRSIAIRTGISFTTIGTMLRGGRGDVGNTIKLARAYHVNPNRMLRLFGHEPIPEFDLIDWSSPEPQRLLREESAAYTTALPLPEPGVPMLLIPIPPGESIQLLTPDGRRLRLAESNFTPLPQNEPE